MRLLGQFLSIAAPQQRDTSITQRSTSDTQRRSSSAILEDNGVQPPRRGLSERIHSLTSSSKLLNDALEEWRRRGGHNQIAENRIKCTKRLSSPKMNLRDLGLTSLPKLDELRMLGCLDLQGNKLEQVPDIEKMLRLRRVEVLGNPVKELPKSFGQKMVIGEVTINKKKNLMTIPLQCPHGKTGKSISLEFYVSTPEQKSAGEESPEANESYFYMAENYSFMTSLEWDGKTRDFPPTPRDNDNSGRGLLDQNNVPNAAMTPDRDSLWGNASVASSEFNFDNDSHFAKVIEGQNLRCSRTFLRDLYGNEKAEFKLNAILVT